MLIRQREREDSIISISYTLAIVTGVVLVVVVTGVMLVMVVTGVMLVVVVMVLVFVVAMVVVIVVVAISYDMTMRGCRHRHYYGESVVVRMRVRVSLRVGVGSV